MSRVVTTLSHVNVGIYGDLHRHNFHILTTMPVAPPKKDSSQM